MSRRAIPWTQDEDAKAKAIEVLQHPIGHRVTDEQLIMAVTLGHVGRARRALPPIMGTTRAGGPAINDLGQGVEYAVKLRGKRKPALERLMAWIKRAPAAPVRRQRTWRLGKAKQRDQDGTPQCVSYTEKHWELTTPIANSRGRTEAENYFRAKQLDGYPGEDGTDAAAMLKVVEEQGLVDSHWWYRGPSDTPAIDEWLLNVGTLWLGAWWPESMFRVQQTKTTGGRWRAICDVAGEFKWGHETLIIATDRIRKTRTIQNSWGRDNWGIDGRAEIRDEDFQRLLDAGGDLVGVVERRAR